MLCPDDPDDMTPEERQAEVVCILAVGFLRLKRRETLLLDNTSAVPGPPAEPEKSSRN
jgi:hypothetical protein